MSTVCDEVDVLHRLTDCGVKERDHGLYVAVLDVDDDPLAIDWPRWRARVDAIFDDYRQAEFVSYRHAATENFQFTRGFGVDGRELRIAVKLDNWGAVLSDMSTAGMGYRGSGGDPLFRALIHTSGTLEMPGDGTIPDAEVLVSEIERIIAENRRRPEYRSKFPAIVRVEPDPNPEEDEMATATKARGRKSEVGGQKNGRRTEFGEKGEADLFVIANGGFGMIEAAEAWLKRKGIAKRLNGLYLALIRSKEKSIRLGDWTARVEDVLKQYRDAGWRDSTAGDAQLWKEIEGIYVDVELTRHGASVTGDQQNFDDLISRTGFMSFPHGDTVWPPAALERAIKSHIAENRAKLEKKNRKSHAKPPSRQAKRSDVPASIAEEIHRTVCPKGIAERKAAAAIDQAARLRMIEVTLPNTIRAYARINTCFIGGSWRAEFDTRGPRGGRMNSLHPPDERSTGFATEGEAVRNCIGRLASYWASERINERSKTGKECIDRILKGINDLRSEWVEKARAAYAAAAGKNGDSRSTALTINVASHPTVDQLSKGEASELKTHEKTIEKSAHAFLDLGNALSEIQEKRLYRDTHGTFEAYCTDRWKIDRSMAYRLIAAVKVNRLASPIVDKLNLRLTNESQFRELGKAHTDDVPEVLKVVAKQIVAGPDGVKSPTAADITAAVKKVKEKTFGKPERSEAKDADQEPPATLPMAAATGISAGAISSGLIPLPAPVQPGGETYREWNGQPCGYGPALHDLHNELNELAEQWGDVGNFRHDLANLLRAIALSVQMAPKARKAK